METICSVLRKIFGSKWEEVKAGCRKLHKEKFRGVSLSPNITRMIQSTRMRWTGHVARMGTGQRNEQKMSVGRREGPEEKKLLLLPRSNCDHSLGFAARSLFTVPTAISQPHILKI
jgi:hypothetical protein